MFRNLEVLKFINVEVYISKTVGVFLKVLSISQSCTHRPKLLSLESSMRWVICWHLCHGNFLKFKSTRMTWCCLTSSTRQQFHQAAVSPLQFKVPSQIPRALALQSNGQRSPRWLLDSDLVFREYPSPFPPCLVFCFTSL